MKNNLWNNIGSWIAIDRRFKSNVGGTQQIIRIECSERYAKN